MLPLLLLSNYRFMQIILLLVVLGGLALSLVQNWSPALSLMFLGVRTQALPLALWILVGVGAGAFTSLVITGLFNLSGYFAPSPRTRKVVDSSRSQPREARQTVNQKQPDNPTPSDATDDWESKSSDDDDWDFEEDEGKKQNSTQEDAKSPNYEVSSEAQSSKQSGSVYSYGYRKSSNSGVGKTESVYDANYRIIPPPSQRINTNKEDDDWGFDDDEDDKEGTRD